MDWILKTWIYLIASTLSGRALWSLESSSQFERGGQVGIGARGAAAGGNREGGSLSGSLRKGVISL